MSSEPENRTAFDARAWLQRHGNYLYRYAFARLSDSSLSERLLEETLLAGIQLHKPLASVSCERSWLLEILKQKLIDRYRSSIMPCELDPKTSDSAELDLFESTGEWTGHWRETRAPIPWSTDLRKLTESPDFRKTFDHCLSSLSPVTASAFTLREIDRLPAEEICDILRISKKGLFAMLHEARLKLRHSLEAEWFRSGHKNSRLQSDEGSHRQETEAKRTLTEPAVEYLAATT